MYMPRVPLLVLALLTVATAVIWYGIVTGERRALTVAYLDVGQGDATYIEAPNGAQLLIDGGADDAVLRSLARQMSPFDRTLDVVLATHPDADHIGGLIAVLERYRVDHVIGSGVASETTLYDAYTAAVAASHARHTIARRGTTIHLGDGVRFTVHFPDRDLTGVDTNAASVIGRLQYGATAFLFTGDSPDAIERTLALADQRALAADVLKVGHHGSDTSTTDIFLAAVMPQYAVISAGADNRYGHPHDEVLTQLDRIGASVFGTYTEGTVVFESNGTVVEHVKEW
jgi:competence protein ComEC